MAITETLIPMPGRLHTLVVGGHLAGADEIIDDDLGKTQKVINSEKADKTEVENANGLAMCMSLAHLSAVGTTTQTTSPEWKYVLLDYADKVLCGIKQDGKSYVYASIAEIMDCINSSYT